MSEIDQAELKAQLQRWSRGEVDARAVHEWAEEIWDQGEWPEYPETDPRSIAVEVLMHLDVLNQQLITREDVPAILAFLETDAGSERQRWARWRRYWDLLDMEERRKELEANPYYAASQDS